MITAPGPEAMRQHERHEPIPPNVVEMAERMRNSQMPWAQIARFTGFSVDRIRGALEDEEYRRRRRASLRRQRVRRDLQDRDSEIIHPFVHRTGNIKDMLARIRDVPRDTRGLTARLMGDPLAGRSALDQRRAP